ncbi:hypothetical protein FJV46_10555 [Arthrobacter agilis]|uniref:hypothetical protein n=1 Tax=Arthrobacter agilis TaxID=37921 RepID=UPI000B34BBD3|nr:hypothetical protein [Arthrobacter agilis]OUM44183.1 hypothetical protein B8W74_04725 [Arthrobacter agilis]PPB46558.1 hypothetical protein CI784_07020 [Arthrobacter agilis]TPV23785.1 hypothetical protein FJV46_10555 [Arthrobacter agilis]VDR32516.1 Uncharacterised protein [Arthrobacter agilis]
MSTTSPAVRHRRRLLTWTVLALLGILVLALTGTPTPTLDGRHLIATIALAGLVLEAERKP